MRRRSRAVGAEPSAVRSSGGIAEVLVGPQLDLTPEDRAGLQPIFAMVSRAGCAPTQPWAASRPRELQVAALFEEAVDLPAQQPQSALPHQWDVPPSTAHQRQVDVDREQLLLVLVGFSDHFAPRVDDV